MKCPNCQSREFSVHEARGFTAKQSPIKECSCGLVWRIVPNRGAGTDRVDIIKKAPTPQKKAA